MADIMILVHLLHRILTSVLLYINDFISETFREGPIPRHVAFIMDGNRRYARQNEVTVAEGHSADQCFALGIEIVSLYAFSLENFKRPQEQVDTLMRLLEGSLLQIHGPNTFVEKHDVQIRVVGRLELLDENVMSAIARTMEATKDNKGKVLNICIAYTSRDEIATAIRATVSACGSPAKITEISLTDNMFMEVPVDLMIRTSGVYRLSDFMLWQCHQHTPIEVVERNWPDFGRFDMGVVLLRWQRRRNQVLVEF
ncbi:unnamed protein product [Penicillium salamii]|uniref:Alkyl transferase n=1 Tax=Penicillium salamii TaxID=1612424 RepID=A0A9W4NGA6_9EURO|nr:unnamed protein product [Penicillium salamii]CAG8309395.1 unnamed protein product [Penicillium salamii]CAG8336441.1 unnamed protein product [Penicillium salamii]CAG8363285.1 unnamed protein product [Penicillium salamii]CAG8372884.1 unnamed protein product [Penicillium salamii]